MNRTNLLNRLSSVAPARNIGVPGRLRKRLALALAPAIMAATTLTGCGDPGQLIGDVLTGLRTTIDGVISEATTEANATLANAASEVQTALDTLASNVSELMDKGVNQVNSTIQNSVNDAKAMVNDLNEKTAAQLNAAIKGAQQLENSLPLTNKNPQLTSYTPLYVSPSVGASSTVAIDLSGNFVHAYEEKMAPTITWPGGPSTPLAAGVLTTQQLTFFVPSSLFSRPEPLSLLNRITFSVNVAYEKGTIFKSIKPGQFRLAVTVLPASPVKSMTLHDVTTQASHPVQPPRQSQSFTRPGKPGIHVYSYDCVDKDQLLGPFHPHEPGWKINPGSIVVDKTYPRGDQRTTVTEVLTTESSVSIRIQTKANCVPFSSGSGDVYVSVSYTEYYQPPTPPATTTSTPKVSDLGTAQWGTTIVQGVTANMWRLDVVFFDGKTKSYNDTDASDPFVKVDYQQGSATVNISVVSLSSLQVKL